MDNIKTFPAAVLLSLTSARGLGPTFSAIHEAAEHVMGHPIWTHEFADAGLWDRMRKATMRAAPSLVPDGVDLADTVTPENVVDVAAEIARRYPNPIAVRRGGEARDETPMESLSRIAPGSAVILVDPDAKQTPGEA